MPTLTVTARGQITFRREILQHLGIKPGDKIEVELLPHGQGLLKAARADTSITAFIGLLADRTDKVASLEELKEAAAAGWQGLDENHR